MTAAYDVPVGRIRKRTESMARLSKTALAVGAALYPEDTREGRPQTYGDCVRLGLGGEHPCPYASCVHHLALDVSLDTGSVTTNFPGRDLDELPATCDLAVAELGGLTLEEVGAVMNLTRERTRQIERVALAKLAALMGYSYEDLATEALASIAPEVRTVPRRPAPPRRHAAGGALRTPCGALDAHRRQGLRHREVPVRLRHRPLGARGEPPCGRARGPSNVVVRVPESGGAVTSPVGYESPITSHSTVTPRARASATAARASMPAWWPFSSSERVACGTSAARPISRRESPRTSRAARRRSPIDAGGTGFGAGIEAASVSMMPVYVNRPRSAIARRFLVVGVATAMVRITNITRMASAREGHALPTGRLSARVFVCLEA